MVPRIPVANLSLNMLLRRQSFMLREKTLYKTRAGNLMLRTLLADKSGTIAGVLFDVQQAVADKLEVGSGVEVSGQIGEFRNQLQVNMDSIVPTKLVDLSEFLPTAQRPRDEMLAELDALLADIRNPHLAHLLSQLLDNPELRAQFISAPASKFNHHACVGGLLEHTLSVARIVLAACGLYPNVDQDLALCGALLHDIGKVRAYDPLTFGFTDEGALWSHLYIGASMVEQAIAACPGFPAELRLRVVHAILSHHGKYENGSPVIPMTVEAIILHYADNLDGDARGAVDHLEREDPNEGPFTERSMMHDTKLYRGERGWTEDSAES
ncbi:MAG: HD domain-containing protein [Chloroflexi bacterium]|nr:HD domain-containing protein [Chloroflexota bacterium]